ncbi:Ig-like domain-containing protein [Leucobacter denitrificans]|uniref:Bacterial Ig-like domain-containing protein n=1 Tax=Leucobacter denitrificans TaxID=683042 RepID=A0A7G9S6Z3_9MICO|nr:Ig-like domain-containing protein [Leucobacter denitrificans]QNN63618.1 hypothetical protein H9L06_04740 [Leucobacter denitrificans]
MKLSARIFGRKRKHGVAARGRMFGAAAIVATMLGGSIGAATTVGPQNVTAAHAATAEAAPEVFKFIAFNDKIDTAVDEFRTSFVLKVPRGYVNPTTGQLTAVDGDYLRLGYDFAGKHGNPVNLYYLNTMDGGAGADRWSRNQDQYFTIHKVISSGKNDFLVISAVGDMNLIDSVPNIVDPGQMNWYLSYSADTNNWFSSALTKFPVDYWNYGGFIQGVNATQGPVVQVQYDDRHSLWSQRQANWAAVLDFGLNGFSPGVLPANSIGVELVNNAFNSVDSGPENSVSDSFWFAWVHEDGSLVTAINTAPIHVSGVTPSRGPYTASNSNVVKNVVPATPGAPTLAYTEEAAAQGLTERVGTDGSVDFTDAGGTGYYRLIVWPEAHSPLNITNAEAESKAPAAQYTAGDLFAPDGEMVEAARALGWTAGTAVYKYEIHAPDAPVIEVPAVGSSTNNNGSIVLSGTGSPGHSITLKFGAASTITDVHSSSLNVIADGDHDCESATCEVMVDESGRWTYTFVPETPLIDGPYSVVALQTEHASGFSITSDPSNPDDIEAPTRWGVTFTVDTVAPAAVSMDCPASPTEDTTPTVGGGGVEAGASVRVYQDGEYVADAAISGSTWSYTFDTEFKSGNYNFTATQVDEAGNESEHSAPPCAVRVSTSVETQGSKVVAPIQNGPSGNTLPGAGNWDITATSASGEYVLNGSDPVKLERDVIYTIGERLHSDENTSSNAAFYVQKGTPTCTDADGVTLPNEIFDPQASELKISLTDDVKEPIRCSIVNQAAITALVTKQVGGQTLEPTSDWTLSAEASNSEFNFELGAGANVLETLPGGYSLSATAPDGTTVLAIQKLNLEDNDCLAASAVPTTVPEECWEDLGGKDAVDTVVQGQPNIFRTVAVSAEARPTLPLTGGLGSWIFTALGLGALSLALIGFEARRRRLAMH